MVLGQVESQRRDHVQVPPQPVQRTDIGLDRRPERRRTLRPDIGGVVGRRRLGVEGGLVRHVERAEGERFLQIGWRLNTDRRREVLGAERLVAPVGLVVRPLPDGELLLQRQVEECAGRVARPLAQRRVDPVAGDQEETDTLAGTADLACNPPPVGATSGEIGAEVDERDLGEGSGRHGYSSRAGLQALGRRPPAGATGRGPAARLAPSV